MTTGRSLLALLTAFQIAVSAYAAEGRPPAPVEFRRANLVVTDIARALQVYRDVLGFTLDGISQSSPESYSYPVFKFPEDAKLRFATLSTSRQSRALALTEVKGVDIDRPPVPHLAALVIRVEDIDSAIAAIRGLGLETVAPTRAETPEGNSFVEQAFVDFDGHLVVLYQLL